MPSTSEKIMEMVEGELEKDRDVSNEVLYEKATSIDPAIKELTLRQFHARFPLQVKRKMSRGQKGGRKKKSRKKTKKKSTTSSSRRSTKKRSRSGSGESDADRRAAAVREVLLQFAKDVSAAEGKAETIDILTQVDSYVADALSAVDGGG